MRKTSRLICTALCVCILLSLSMYGCGKNKTTPTNATGKTENSKKTETLTMVMSNSGLTVPDGVDVSNNEFINIVKKYANVDLKISEPSYQDFETKITLMLSSGNIPDIVHTYLNTDADKKGDEGAFIDLKSYYDKSKMIQKYITPQMMELAKSASGHNYRIPMAYDQAPQGSWIVARGDLVKKYNNNKFPTSVDEWLNLFRAEKKADPKSMPLSNRITGDQGINYGGAVIYDMFGANPYGTRIQNGKVISNFSLPECKKATQIMKQMYDEGILDKEFATNDDSKWFAKKKNNNVIVEINSADQIIPSYQVSGRKGLSDPTTKTNEYVFAPMLTTFPSEVKDPKYVYPFQSWPIVSHGLYISSKCKDKDRAFKVIEGFSSDDLYNMIFWGKQGTEYTVQNGQKVINTDKMADTHHTYGLAYALVFGFMSGQDEKKLVGEQGCGKDYSDMVYNSINPIDKLAKDNGIDALSFVNYSDNANKKSAESQQYITKTLCGMIMGRISINDYDKKVEEYNKNYGFINDEAQKYLDSHKAELSKKGCKNQNW